MHFNSYIWDLKLPLFLSLAFFLILRHGEGVAPAAGPDKGLDKEGETSGGEGSRRCQEKGLADKRDAGTRSAELQPLQQHHTAGRIHRSRCGKGVCAANTPLCGTGVQMDVLVLLCNLKSLPPLDENSHVQNPVQNQFS